MYLMGNVVFQKNPTIMQRQYESDGTSHETEWWELHGNISRNGYGNAIIARYVGRFEEGI